MSKLEDVTRLVAQRTAELYKPGNERQLEIYKAITIEKAIERGESVVDAMALIDVLRLIGIGLNEEERANAHSSDKTVAVKAAETNIEQNLTASGKPPEEIAMTLGVLKNIGALMAGGGVSQARDNAITPNHTPNVVKEQSGPALD